MKVKFFTNGNVMVFDEEGEQIPELQGFLFNVIPKLREVCDEETNFSFNKWKGREMKCDFGWWFENNNKEQDLKETIENRTEDVVETNSKKPETINLKSKLENFVDSAEGYYRNKERQKILEMIEDFKDKILEEDFTFTTREKLLEGFVARLKQKLKDGDLENER